MKKREYLFVYGTLRRGARHEKHRLLEDYAGYAGEATFRGRLYMVEDYPGAVRSENPEDVVHGEVYLLRSSRVLKELDEYEGCSHFSPEPKEFIRERAEVILKSGETVSAWMYLYNSSTENLRMVASGDYLSLGEER